MFGWISTDYISRMCPGVPVVKPRIIDVLYHDSAAFTQGLVIHEGFLYESTGLYGKSTIRKLSLAGEPLIVASVPNAWGEGIAIVNGELIQLTWRERIAIRYNLRTLKRKGKFDYFGEGWGLCAASGGYFMSNGSAKIFRRNEKFEPLESIVVTVDNREARLLNDLEYARNKIYANVFCSEFIFEIEPGSGSVERLIDCSELIQKVDPHDIEQVLKGIAFYPEQETFYLSGKHWNKLFVVKM